MAGEVIRTFGTVRTLEANGASIANNAIAQADDASYSTATHGANFPDAEFVLGFTFATAPTEGTTLALVARLLNIDGTDDAQVPEATRADRFIGSFIVNNVTTLQDAALFAYNVPREADYYILNSGTGQTVSAGWILKVTPMTFTTA
jgi:hypothetical protein